jgi:hypothetical protein
MGQPWSGSFTEARGRAASHAERNPGDPHVHLGPSRSFPKRAGPSLWSAMLKLPANGLFGLAPRSLAFQRASQPRFWILPRFTALVSRVRRPHFIKPFAVLTSLDL